MLDRSIDDGRARDTGVPMGGTRSWQQGNPCVERMAVSTRMPTPAVKTDGPPIVGKHFPVGVDVGPSQEFTKAQGEFVSKMRSNTVVDPIGLSDDEDFPLETVSAVPEPSSFVMQKAQETTPSKTPASDVVMAHLAKFASPELDEHGALSGERWNEEEPMLPAEPDAPLVKRAGSLLSKEEMLTTSYTTDLLDKATVDEIDALQKAVMCVDPATFAELVKQIEAREGKLRLAEWA